MHFKRMIIRQRKKMKTIIKRIITSFCLIILFLSLFIYLPSSFFSALLFSILLYIVVFEWPNLFDWHRTSFWLLMPLYPVMPFVLLILMNYNSTYRFLLFILFIMVAVYDAGSFIAGNLIGRHKCTTTNRKR